MVLSGACVVAIVAGLEELIRRGWWRDLGRLLLAGVCVEMLIVAGDMVLGARVGAYTGGDATLHVARIRFLLDNGLSNIDPYVGCHLLLRLPHQHNARPARRLRAAHRSRPVSPSGTSASSGRSC